MGDRGHRAGGRRRLRSGAAGRQLLPILLAILALAACAGSGPITDCVVQDSRGNLWRGSDVTPLSAEETARIACGSESPDPGSCRVQSCGGRW